jgi:hypothetical protein
MHAAPATVRFMNGIRPVLPCGLLLPAEAQALVGHPIISPAYAVSGAGPPCSNGALSTAGNTLQVASYVASRGQFT